MEKAAEVLSQIPISRNRIQAAQLRLDSGKLRYDRGELEEAAKNYGEALKIYQMEGHQGRQAGLVYLKLGEIQRAQNKPKKAVVQYTEALRIIQKEFGKNSKEACVPLFGLANLNQQQVDFPQAFKYFELLLKVMRKHHPADSVHIAKIHISVGDTHILNGTYDEAAQQYRDSARIYLSECPEEALEEAQEIYNLAEEMLASGESIGAINRYKKALVLCGAV